MKDKRIRLLCISRHYYPDLGGMSKYSTEIFSRIDENDFDVKLLMLRKSQIKRSCQYAGQQAENKVKRYSEDKETA